MATEHPTAEKVILYAIVWLHEQNGWYAWEFVRARSMRKDLFADLRGLRKQYPNDKFKIGRFEMVQK